MDKEQIIIDGVDVSKCKHFPLLMYKDHPKWTVCHEWGSGECRKRPDCYFKQLARKTTECEELKAYAQRQENQREEYYKEYLKLSQECEELKERLERVEENLKYQCVDCMNVKSDRYRKALEEIEKIVKDWYKNEWSCYKCRINMDKKLKNILGIINKAKGENKNE